MVACTGCGNQLENDARFCERCGRSRTPLQTNAEPVRTSAKQALFERVRTVAAGRFDVRGEIGRGGMAAVFVAQDLRLNRRVALKVMLPGLAFTDGMSERFEQEARTAANLDHPNIVTIFGVEEVDDLLFFVMKYVEGRSLDKVTRDVGPLPIDVTVFILLHVAMALAYAHDEKVVHRDVKPGNVLLDRRGTPIVTDFGIAKAAESPSLTVPGSIVGTPAYMSPEQFMGLPALPASDQYALGIMAYEMLAGELPFQGSMVELQLKHIQDAPQPIRDVRRDIPAPLGEIVMRMLAKQPQARFGTLHDAERALRALPLDESVARARLVELGLLTDGTSPSGLPPTPVRSAEREATKEKPVDVEKERAKSAPNHLAPPKIRVVERDVATPPRSEPALPAEDDKTVVQPRELTPRASRAVAPLEPAVAYVRITSAPSNVATGEVVPLHGVAYDNTNTPIPGKHVAWEISPTAAGRIAADGTLTTLAPGAITVTALCEGKRSLAEIQVTPVPATQKPASVSAANEASVIPRDHVVAREREAPLDTESRGGGQSVLTTRAIVMAAVAVLVVVGAIVAGRLTGGGRSTVASQVDEPATIAIPAPPPPPEQPAAIPDSATPPSGTSTALSLPLTPASVKILGAPAEMRMGDRARLRAEVMNAGGEPIGGARVVWSSTDASVLQVDAARGSLRALRPGSADVVAKSGDAEERFSLKVATPRLRSLVIQDLRSLPAGESLTLHLAAQSDAGLIDATTLGTMGITPRWSSSAPNVARIDSRTGELSALTKGSATIVVEAGELRGSEVLTVMGGGTTPAQPTPTPPVPVATPDRTPPRAPPPERRARTESDVLREVTDVLKTYSAAVSARDLEAMQRVFPGMQEKDRKQWRSFFSNASEVTYTLDRLEFERPIDLSPSGQISLNRFWTLAFTVEKPRPSSGKSDGKDRVTMVRGADGWHITQIQ